MSKLPLIALVAISLMPGRSWAQLAPPNDNGVSMGQWYTIVHDVDTAKKFWLTYGGKAITIDGMPVIKIPGVLIFLQKGEPTGGTEGSSVNHLGVKVAHGRELKEKLKADGVRMDPGDPVTGRPGFWKPGLRSWGDVYNTDNLKVEILDNVVEGEAGKTTHLAGVADQSMRDELPPVAADHIHMYFGDKASFDAAGAWYGKLFGAKRFSDTGAGTLIPGARMRFDIAAERRDSQQKPVPTKGRALDHIGFEVKNLEGFCKNLEASGIKLDAPYSKKRHKSFASAELTDPFGTSIELTEGLSKF